jgi:GrpB-like predicted nucleotidyltransferase (UPF0157 family)
MSAQRRSRGCRRSRSSIAGVRDLADADVAAPALEALGYVRAIHRTDAVLFNKGSAAQHTHHLHLTVPGSDLWGERLAFRDALRHDPVLVVEYTELKARLLRQVWWAALWRHG